ncbi:MAG: SulP family inorganic anion transporter [Byssovorax sp.]
MSGEGAQPSPAGAAPDAGRAAPAASADPRGFGARLLSDLIAGGISALLGIFFSITFAVLIFKQDLSPSLPHGIGIILASSCVTGAFTALLSSFRPVVAGPQENSSVILTVMAAAIARSMPAGADPVPTLVVAFGLTSLATALLFFILGTFRLGTIVRFIPSPVVGGFLAGTGWLLVQDSLGVITGLSGFSFHLDQLPRLFEPGVPFTWLFGVAFGVLLTLMLRRQTHFLVLPGLLVGGIGLFFLLLVVLGIGVHGAMERGYLLGHLQPSALWPPVGVDDLRHHVDWTMIKSRLGDIIVCPVLGAIAVLLNATGLELATEQDIDLDHELRVGSAANAAAGLLGCIPGYLLLGESTLNYKVGARSRLPGIFASICCGLTVAVGTDTLAYFPKPVLGGLLFFLGFSFLLETVYDSWFRLPRLEYGLVVLIFFVVVKFGFLEGVGAGIIVSSVLFAVNYARIDVVKNSISGSLLRSKAGRSPADEALLRELGDQVHIVQLQGYVFFGTSSQLLQRIKDRLTDPSMMRARFIVLDFRFVDGIDSSVSFSSTRRMVEAYGAVLVLTGMASGVRSQLERAGGIMAAGGAVPRASIKIFEDLDHGLEWCEDQLLSRNADSRPSTEAIASELRAFEQHKNLVQRLLPYLERIDAPKGYQVYTKGERAGDLILIDSGQLAAWLDHDDGRSTRLRTMGAGSVVGESGLYLGQPRSATVRTTRPSVLYRLTTEKLDKMGAEAPELEAAFHQFVATILAERMVNTTTAAQMLFY